MRSGWKRFPAAALAFCLLAITGRCPAAYVTGSENVSGTRNTPQYTVGTNTYGPYGWNYSYTRSFDGTKIEKDIEIKFAFDSGVGYDAAQQTAFINQAIANIRSVWNNKYAVKDNTNGTLIPCVVDITTSGPFDQSVTIYKTEADTPQNNVDMTHWTIGDSANVQGHEVGHMMGLFDEYIGGAVNQYPNPLLSNDGLMGLGGAQGANYVMYDRYYQQYLDYFKSLNRGDFSLVAVPLPAAWAGAGAILLVLLIRKALTRREG